MLTYLGSDYSPYSGRRVANCLTSHLSARPNESLAWIRCRKHGNGLVDKIDDILIANADDSKIASLDFKSAASRGCNCIGSIHCRNEETTAVRNVRRYLLAIGDRRWPWGRSISEIWVAAVVNSFCKTILRDASCCRHAAYILQAS